jgi:hypothetical protein
MPTVVADPDMPAAAPADPDAALTGTRLPSRAKVALRSSKTTATLNRFFTRVQTQLQRLADRGGDIALEAPLDMNGQRITGVPETFQLASLVSRAQAREILGVDDV